MGLLIVLSPITKGVKEVAAKSGVYENPMTGTRYPKVQVITAEDLLAGKRPLLPTPITPYLQAKSRPADHPTLF